KVKALEIRTPATVIPLARFTTAKLSFSVVIEFAKL
ncbi:MAG: hypothetical protein K0R46_1846, partial [Herbinix sp.]|nr:hypothetical protein [Herbinix sp.]